MNSGSQVFVSTRRFPRSRFATIQSLPSCQRAPWEPPPSLAGPSGICRWLTTVEFMSTWNTPSGASWPARTVGFGQDIAVAPAGLALALKHPEMLECGHVAADARQRYAGIPGELAQRWERLAGLVDVASETRQQPAAFGAGQGLEGIEGNGDDLEHR